MLWSDPPPDEPSPELRRLRRASRRSVPVIVGLVLLMAVLLLLR
ncbi:morphogenic membrane protein MmpB [Kitasatospora sp. McL0602]